MAIDKIIHELLESKLPILAVKSFLKRLPKEDLSVHLKQIYLSENIRNFPLLSEIKYVSPADLNNQYKNLRLSHQNRFLNNLLNIEFHAILSYGLLLMRYEDPILRMTKFVDSVIEILRDEATHFCMLHDYFEEQGLEFGSFPVNDNILRDLEKCKNILDQLAMISLTHEARALDSGPRLMQKLNQFPNKRLPETLSKIIKDEQNHVRFGVEWFEFLCNRDGHDKRQFYKEFLKRFQIQIYQANEKARQDVGFDFYN